ncbi:hypothetical protein Tco_0687610 [Tanacetum coccineum]
MLATGRYAQWQSRFLRYVDTKPNKQELRQCIFDGPYVMTEITVPAKPTTTIEEAVPEHTIVETYKTTTPEKFDACTTAKEMWISIKRLHQGESLNKQDVKTSLFLEFGKFTSRDGESIESYYSRFYKMMNEMVRNKLEVSTMQTGHFGNQRTVAGARKTIGNQLDDTDEEPDEQELEAYYMYMAKMQEVLTTESRPTFDVEPLEHADQNAEEYEDKRVVLANLIANLKLDHDENKKILKQLNKENASLTHELNECKSALEESNDI